MQIKQLDLFSSPFHFNVKNQKSKKRTVLGAVLSISVVLISLAYFIYLLFEYLNNQIDPKFRAQSFVTQDNIDIDLHNEIVGFSFQTNTEIYLDDVQQQQNKTYMVFQAYLQIMNKTNYNVIQLNTFKCQDSQLKGYDCIDFSSVSNYTLSYYSQSRYRSNIVILGYRCQDVDQFKSDVPSNCASPDEVDALINSPDSSFNLKLYTSQYNTTSNQIQKNYRNQDLFLQTNQFNYIKYKTQKQQTQVKQGPIIQYESNFHSPIQYTSYQQTFDYKNIQAQAGLSMIMQINIEVDEIVQYFLIQYPTFPEILALCNSALALLMSIGFIARYFSGRLIREDFFLLFLQNMYQETFSKISQASKLFRSQQNDQQVIKSETGQQLKAQSIQENNKNIEEDQIYIEDLQPVFVPQFKSRKSILYQCPSPLSYNQSTQNNQQEDEVIENSEKLSYKISESQISNKYFKQNFFKSKNKNDNSSALEFKKENINLVQESHQISKNIDAEQPINRQNIIKDCQNKFLFESSNLGKVFQSQKQQKEKQNAETIKMVNPQEINEKKQLNQLKFTQSKSALQQIRNLIFSFKQIF